MSRLHNNLNPESNWFSILLFLQGDHIRGDGAISPRLEELERDLGATLQLNDEREEEIAKLKEEIVRLQREKEEVDEGITNLSLEIKQLQSQISQKDEDFLRLFERNSAMTEEVEKERNAVEEKKIEVEKLGDEQRVAAKLAVDRLEGMEVYEWPSCVMRRRWRSVKCWKETCLFYTTAPTH